MPVATTDIKFRKSLIVSDSSNNGGRKGYVQVVSGARHNLFPRVTKNERTNGVTRYRKEFISNENTSDETAYAMECYLESPTNGQDSIQLASGSQVNVQSDILTAGTAPSFLGCGQLNAALETDDTEAVIVMESALIEFPNGGKLHVSDKFAVSQTIDTDVQIGDSVTYNAGTWEKISSTDDITYPNGLYLGSNAVMTLQNTTHEEWLSLKDNLHTAEVIGTGDGTTSPTLSTLTYKTNGICKQTDKRPVVTAVHGGANLTVTIDRTGLCSGDCSAGQLNMTTGAWTTPITWTDTIDNPSNITITYRENCFSYSGNVATVELDESPLNDYAASNTYAGGCLSFGDVKTSSDSWVETSSAGTFDETTYPPICFNDGTVEDTFTITMTGATTFTCAGASEGSLGTGSTLTNFSPVNANTGQPYFTIDADGWGGTWQSGDTIVFKTHPSVAPIWLKEVVPAGAAQAPNNLLVLGYYCE